MHCCPHQARISHRLRSAGRARARGGAVRSPFDSVEEEPQRERERELLLAVLKKKKRESERERERERRESEQVDGTTPHPLPPL